MDKPSFRALNIMVVGMAVGIFGLIPSPPALAQLLLPPDESDKTVELVLAESEQQAQVVGRAMRTGFLIDQLLIPGTSYIGRMQWKELNSHLQTVLHDTPAGEPTLLSSGKGKFMVARVLEPPGPALLGSVRYAQESQEIWAVLSSGPTDSRLLSMEVDVHTDDLAAICKSKQQLIEGMLQRTRAMIAAMPSSVPPRQQISAYADLVSLLSFKGEMAEAIQEIGKLMARLPADITSEKRSLQDVMHQVLGMLELRRGEVENCMHHHNAEMCLFPLSDAARHRAGDGAQRAFKHFSQYLENHPDDLEGRWLLNIAAMTIGIYPEGIPEAFRIGPESFASPVDLGRFRNVADEAGLVFSDNAGGSVADDFDGDGFLDLVVSSRDPCEPLRFFHNRGDGGFEDLTEAAGLSDQLGGLNVTHADFDNDGRRDLLVLRGGWETAIRNSLLRNRQAADGSVIFEDVTENSGLGGPGHRTQTAAWADYDGDGVLDVFLGNEMSFSQLLRGRGDGTFEDSTEKAGVLLRSLTKGAVWGDVNGDTWPDLYVSNFGERNLLFVNRGDGTFEEVGRERGVSEPTYSFTTWFWDYDNDGWQDLLVVTLLQTVDEVAREYLGLPQRDETLRVFRNRGDGSFEDTTSSLGLARNIPTMGANFGDLNNDGYLDFYLGTGAPSYGMLVPNRMFLNQGGKSFVDVTTSTGTGHLQKGHGVAFADLDNDGDQDVFANQGGAFPGDKYPNVLFENPGQGNDWIAIELIGTRSHRDALGARLRVVLDEGGQETQRVRWVTPGGSFGSSPLMQQIGLGADAKILRIEIDWPALASAEQGAATQPVDPSAQGRLGRQQVLRDVPVNQFIRVTEGTEGFELIPRQPLELGAGHDGRASAHHH